MKMAAAKPDKKAAVKRKPTSKKYSLYVVSGGTVKRKNKSCPKCGPGVFLAAHKDRLYCGQCHYTEKTSK